MNTFIVIPTIRSLSFLSAWKEEFRDCSLVIVEDHEKKEIVPPTKGFRSIFHTTWQDIRKDFGRDEWIFSRMNAGIRSYGFWKAYQLGADVIITLDDDCFPADRPFVKRHLENLHVKAPFRWAPTYPHADVVYTRGIPYSVRGKHQVMVSHGLWTGAIDLDGQTEANHPFLSMPVYPSIRQFVPFGQYFPMCSMNLAFRREAISLMYFPPMGKKPDGKAWGFDRFDDIWAGVFAKKIMDHLGWSVVNGSPFIEHRKASDPKINIQKEKTGLPVNEKLWKWVDEVELTGKTAARCYRELAQKVKFPTTPYFFSLRKAMILWSELFI